MAFRKRLTWVSQAGSWAKLKSRARKPKRIYFRDLKHIVNEEMSRKKDYVICITGDEGEGKSLTAIQIARRLFSDFDFNKNEIYTESTTEFSEKYLELQRETVLVIDEAIKLLYKMDFQLKPVKKMIKKYAADVRKEKLACHILCIPTLNELHPNFRKHRVKMWIELMPRQYAKPGHVIGMVFVKERMPFLESTTDVWFMGMFAKLWEELKTAGQLEYAEQKIMLMRMHPYYKGEIVIKQPVASVELRYLSSRARALKKYGELLEEDETGGKTAERYKKLLARIYYFLFYRMRWKVEQISKLAGVSPAIVHVTLRKIREAPDKYPFAVPADFEKPLPELPDLDLSLEDENDEEKISLEAALSQTKDNNKPGENDG